MQPGDLFSPAGVALVGASEERHYPRSILLNLIAAGYPKQRIYPVHPRHRSVLGLKCYRSLAALPGPASLVVLATPRETVSGLLEEAADAGGTAAVVLADGFAEQGPAGRLLQEKVAEVCARRQLALLGPNTLGFMAPAFGVGTWAGGELPWPLRRGGLAMVSQSSGTLNLLLAQAGYRHLGISAAVSVGNEAVMEAADFISYLADDPSTRVIACFLETATHPGRLARALEAAAAVDKPVVTLKVGKSERARVNAVAHTGRLASSGAAWEAFLQRLGVILVQDLDELLETSAIMLHRKTPTPRKTTLKPSPQGRGREGSGGLGIATISGGDCGLLADLCQELLLPLPDVGPARRKVLVEALQKEGLLGNPLDCENLRREDQARFDTAIDAFCAEPAFDLVAFRMNLDQQPTPALRVLYSDLLGRAAAANRMAVVLSRSAEPLDSTWFEFFEGQDTAFLPAYRTALASIGHFLRWRPSGGLAPPAAIPEETGDPDQPTRTLGWTETQDWLRRAGIPYAEAGLASSPRGAAHLATQLGFPVALKVAAADLPHKTESGAVSLGLASPEEVEAAAAQMGKRHPEREGFEVQAMAASGIEMIVGMTRDPAIGPVILVGSGGVLAELVADVVMGLPPLDEDGAEELVGRLAVARLLQGFRGRPAVSISALARLLTNFSNRLVGDADDLVEVDLNPVIVTAQEAVAVDALVRVRA